MDFLKLCIFILRISYKNWQLYIVQYNTDL